MAKLEVEFGRLKFENPIVVASMDATYRADLIKQCSDTAAAGAFIIRICTQEQLAAVCASEIISFQEKEIGWRNPRGA